MTSTRLKVFILLLLLFIAALPNRIIEAAHFKIVINLPAFNLRLYQDSKIIRNYPVAIGKPSSPTPLGETEIGIKLKYPTYFSSAQPIPPGPKNPLGSRWLGLGWPRYGIHGTNKPDRIRWAVSKGCIRMHNKDVEELFELVSSGTPVKIIYKTVELFSSSGDTLRVAVHPDIYGYQPGGIKEIDFSDLGLKNIETLKFFNSLEKINLSNNSIDNLETFAHLPLLTELNLAKNNIRDISPLKNLKHLEVLNLNENLIEDIAILKNLPHLTSVSLINNPILDLSPLLKNSNLGQGTKIKLGKNIFDQNVIEKLKARGVNIAFDTGH